ncbi:transglutaminase-like domain-containing protein, partial [Baaleninema simplex]
PRQSVRHLEPVGLPFETRVIDEQPIAVFQFDRLKPHEARIFGWRAILEVRGIKYHFKPRDVDDLPEMPPEYQQRYLVDNDNLAMDTETVQRAARNAIGTETNLLRQVLNIRDYVYDRLEYGIKPHIDTPDIVLKRGMGSCGEYVGILLALLRLNGIACRTVGRYKCPDRAESREVALQPDFNHVWLEFLIPGYGWIPMESNPDDMHDRGPHPLRFFMGLAWYHIELVKGVKFESLVRDGKRIPKEEVSLGDLAINHVRFRILEELPPKR